MARRRLCVLLCATFGLGCGGPEPAVEPGDESTSESSGTDTDTGTDADTGTSTDTGEELGSTVSGVVVDEQGAPIADLPVTLCGEVCQVGMTDAGGAWEIVDVAAGPKVIEPALVPIEGELEDAVLGWTRFFDIVTVVEGEDLHLDEPSVMLRVEGTVGPLTGPQDLEPVPGLAVRFDADYVASEGALPVGVDAVWLGGRTVPQELWPTGGLGDWTVVEAWAFAPWDLDGEDAFAVEATLPAPLPMDAEVAFLVADYTYGFMTGLFWEEPAELSPDGLTLSTPMDGGLDRATMWLAVTR